MATISVQKNNGATYLGTLPKLKRDYLIEAGTKGIFDFATTYTNDGLDVAVGKQFKNLVDNGNPATILSNAGLTQVTGGLKVLNGVAQIQLPEEMKLPSTCTNFVAIAWVKRIAGTPDFMSYGNFGGGSTQYGLYSFNTPRSNYAVDAVGASFDTAVNVPIQIAVEYLGNGVNSKMRMYFNGVLSNENTFDNGGSLNLPTSTFPKLFYHSPNNSTSEAVIYRVLLDDLTVSGRTGASLVAADYEKNKTRFV